MTLRAVNKWHQFVIIVVVNRVPRLRLSMVLNNSDQTCCTSIVMKRNKMFRLILTDFALNGVFKTIYFANFKISRNTIVLDSSAYCTSLWNNQMFQTSTVWISTLKISCFHKEKKRSSIIDIMHDYVLFCFEPVAELSQSSVKSKQRSTEPALDQNSVQSNDQKQKEAMIFLEIRALAIWLTESIQFYCTSKTCFDACYRPTQKRTWMLLCTHSGRLDRWTPSPRLK